jgi:putative transposase
MVHLSRYVLKIIPFLISSYTPKLKAADSYQPATAKEENLRLMEEIDKIYLKYPFFGTHKMTEVLKEQGYEVNRKRLKRLYQLMGIQAVGPKPNTSKPVKGHKIYPYLLRSLKIDRVNQVWAADLTYIPMPNSIVLPICRTTG